MTDESMQKKSLMNSLHTFETTVSRLEGLNNSSYRLLKKFTEPIPEPKEEGKEMDMAGATKYVSKDLVDLFNDNLEEMGRLMNQIGENINQTIDYID